MSDGLYGLDVVIGARTKQTSVIGDSGITDWDSHSAYSAGDRVRYWGNWYKATRDISSSIWGNDTPDKSDAWTVIPPNQVVGMFDIATQQRQMNGVKPVTLGIARAMLKYGQAVIAHAIVAADLTGLPGGTARKNCQAHLQWHEDTLSKQTGDLNSTIYASGDDLKKWVMQAFIEENAVEEGAAYLDDAWNKMWSEIADGLAKIPAQIAKAAAPIVNAAKYTYWIAIGTAVVVLGIVATGVGLGVKHRIAGR